MDIYYLCNSGFTLEHGGDALVFDYYRGSLGGPRLAPLARKPSDYRDIYVFASHAHADHYNPDIFGWVSERRDIRYILSNDIRPSVPAGVRDGSRGHKLIFINEGERVAAGNLSVRAFGSTDAGVSFCVGLDDGTVIFHAGDFNFWHWRDESSREEIEEARASFDRVLADIKINAEKPDVAFFPVDPRMKTDYHRGAVLFCGAVRPAMLIPMHFSGRFAPPPGFYDELPGGTVVAVPGPSAGRIADFHTVERKIGS